MSVSELLETDSSPIIDIFEPASSAAMSLRQAEVEQRQKQVGKWLADNGFDAAVFADPDSVAWFTAGARRHPSVTYDWANPSLIITPTSRSVVCSDDQACRLFAEEIDALGFQVKQTPWIKPVRETLVELCNGRRVASDMPLEAAVLQNRQIAALRLTLTDYDVSRLRHLASHLSHAVEATCRQMSPGDSEWEIRGHVTHRLLRHDIEPEAIHIFADDRAPTCASPRPRDLPVKKHCCLLVTGRSRGLYATTSRTVCFGPAPADLQERFRVATIVSGTLCRFSIGGEKAGNVLQRALRLYQKHRFEFAWRDAPLGAHAGYIHRCFPMTPSTQGSLRPNSAVCWMPQVKGSVSADTVLVKQDKPELLSYREDWPTIGVMVREMTIDRPDMLLR